jgi:hypothetical protein
MEIADGKKWKSGGAFYVFGKSCEKPAEAIAQP